MALDELPPLFLNLSSPTIKDTIKAQCSPPTLQPSLVYLFYYVFRDFAMVWAALVWAAFSPTSPAFPTRHSAAAWMVSSVPGSLLYRVWILGHECGHGAFSLHGKVNNWFLLVLLVPYFSWKYSHHRHHRFTGLDMAYLDMAVPKTEPKPSKIAGIDVAELIEDTPPGKGSKQWAQDWPFVVPSSVLRAYQAVFRPNEAIVHPHLRIGLLFAALYFASKQVGVSTILFLYLVPYLWVHHGSLPHYTAEGWTYCQGSLATVDREFGFIGKHLFHVRSPSDKADEATEAIKPVIGDHYCHDDRSFLGQLWTTSAPQVRWSTTLHLALCDGQGLELRVWYSYWSDGKVMLDSYDRQL
ncbi:hypothetical protein CEK25_007587 [Fusarium fujikuroi]|nr:hypothetical protein CEK25_007587 [Fusarium fujikuroi]